MTTNGTKIVRNGSDHTFDVVWSELIRWVARVATGVAVVLIASAALATVALFRQQDRLMTVTETLSSKVDALAESNRAEWQSAKTERECLRLGQEQLKRRVTLLDKRLD